MGRHLTVVCCILVASLSVTSTASAKGVTWDGLPDMTWESNDTTSWSGATYIDGDTPTFSGLGSGTVTVHTAGVAPGNMTFSSGTYTIEGGAIGGPGSLSTSGAALTLSNTNTYSGRTIINSGTLTTKGKDAVSPNTKFYMQRSAALTLMMDDAGTVNLGNEIEFNAVDTSSSQTTTYTITVRNNGASTTDSTIALGLMDFYGGGGNFASARIIRVTGANGYRLQVGDVDMNVHSAATSEHRNQGFRADSAPITISGTVKQIDGNGGNTTANVLYLGGTNANNLVTGTISDPDDYRNSSNPLAMPLQVRINGGTHNGLENAEWTFMGTNCYSGTTTINRGKLIIDNGPKSQCLDDSAALVIITGGQLGLADGVKEAVGSLFFDGAQKAIGEWGSSDSSANNVNDTYFSGEGLLYVGMDIPPSGMVLIIR